MITKALRHELENTKVGTIVGISGHPMSGLWMLQLDTDLVHIGSGYGVRSLAACFGATEGTGDLLKKIKGKKIAYSTDAFNVLEGFTPYEEWLQALAQQGITEEQALKICGQ